MVRPGGLIIALSVLSVVAATPHLLGRRECTFGPSYWCENIAQSKQCNAFSHCLQTVWTQHKYPQDNDSICKICLDMVQQARDQLRSNETEQEIMQVFDASCNIIPRKLKVIRDKCKQLTDDFAVELVDILSSEMDPTAVCSTAGLCNNKNIDQMLLDLKEKEKESSAVGLSCGQCETVADQIVANFHATEQDDLLDGMLDLCRYANSYSDACSSIVILNFQSIYEVLKERLSRDSICHLSGVCALKYHQHPERVSEQFIDDGDDTELEIRPLGNVGMIDQNPKGDDVPCDFCKQLVVHLRDIVVANSTEQEMETVLIGICGQLKEYKTECTNFVKLYIKDIFDTLNVGLNPEFICKKIGICPDADKKPTLFMPLLPLEPAKILISLKKKEPVYTKEEVDAFQLPIDSLMGPQNANRLVENGVLCEVCESVMHFVQMTITQGSTEEEIKESVEKVCERYLPGLSEKCTQFVNTYGDAVIALLVNEMDPKIVCSELRMCSAKVKEDVEIFQTKLINVDIKTNDKPTCPLCLFAMTEAQARIQSNKSIDNIKHTLETLCSHLPVRLVSACTEMVESNAERLVKLLMQEMTPQQICVELQMCSEQQDKAVPKFNVIGEDSMENEIDDNTVGGRVVVMGHRKPTTTSTPECLVCQHLVKELEKKLDSNKSRDQIKKILDHVCDKVKPDLKNKCVAFIDKHEEQIIDLVMKGVSPKELCIALGFCMIAEERDMREVFAAQIMNGFGGGEVDEMEIDFISVPASPLIPGRVSVLNKAVPPKVENRQPPAVTSNEGCVLCEFIMKQVEDAMKKKETDDQIRDIVENICKIMPKSVSAKCNKFIDQYAEMVIQILATTPPAEVCKAIALCTPPKRETEVIEQANKDVVECAICQGAVVTLDKMLEDPNFDKDLEKVVNKVCFMTKNYQKKCSEMIYSYGPSIINMILAKAQPEKICEELSLCFPNEYSTFLEINDEVIPSRIRRRRNALLGSGRV